MPISSQSLSRTSGTLGDIGLIKAITYDLNRVRTGEINASGAIDSICAGLTGSGIVAMGWFLARAGLLVGGMGDTPEDEYAMQLGEQAYSLQIGDKSYTIDWTAPVAMPLFVGAEFARITEGEFQLSDIPDAVATIFEPMLSLSMLDGLNRTLASVRYDSADQALINILKTVAGSYFSQGVPTLMGQIARTADASRRTTFTPADQKGTAAWLNRTWQTSVQSKLPGKSQERMQYINVWGRPEVEENVAIRAFKNFLSPGYMNTVSTSGVDLEISRLADETGDTGVIPSRARKSFKIGGEDRVLTQREYEQLLVEQGQSSYRMVSDFISSPVYDGLSDAERAYAIGSIYDYAADVARYHIDAAYKDDMADWAVKLMDAEEALGLDPVDYLTVRAKSNETGIKPRIAAISSGLDPMTTASILAVQESDTKSFTDPNRTGYEYILDENQQARYSALLNQNIRAGYEELVSSDKYRAASLEDQEDSISEMLSEARADTKKAFAKELRKQGIRSTRKD